jgi:hypothetical protein
VLFAVSGGGNKYQAQNIMIHPLKKRAAQTKNPIEPIKINCAASECKSGAIKWHISMWITACLQSALAVSAFFKLLHSHVRRQGTSTLLCRALSVSAERKIKSNPRKQSRRKKCGGMNFQQKKRNIKEKGGKKVASEREVCINLHYKCRECCDYDNEWRSKRGQENYGTRKEKKFCSEQKNRHRCRRDCVRWSGEQNNTKLGQQQKQTHTLPEREAAQKWWSTVRRQRWQNIGNSRKVSFDGFILEHMHYSNKEVGGARAATPTAINSDLQVKSH